MKPNYLVLSMLTIACAGCANANWSTVNRTTNLPEEGKAIHLDAPQRLAYSDKHGHVCTEPTPDALQAYAAAIGVGLSVPTKGSASLTNALQTSASSVGLHTQSITLMREILYRICEESYNGKLDDSSVNRLLERSQDLTLGVLAIEQLTGTITPRQVILEGNTTATASSNVADTKAVLDSIRKDEGLKKQALKDAQAEQAKKKQQVDETQSKLDAENKKNPKNAEVISQLETQLADQKKNLDAANNAVTDAEAAYSDAQKATKAVQDNFSTAIASANAVAHGTGAFSPEVRTQTINKDTVQEIAKATNSIVEMLLTKGHLTDACIDMMGKYASMTQDDKKAIEPFVKQCNRIIEANITAYLEQVKKEVADPASTGTKPANPKPAPKPGNGAGKIGTLSTMPRQ